MSKNVFVFVEQRRGVVQKVSYELLGKGRTLADRLGQKLCAVLPGSGVTEVAAKLFGYGADEVYVADAPILANYSTEPYAQVMDYVIHTYEPEIVLYGATSIGRDLAPRMSARLHTGLTADCTGLEIGEAKGKENQLLMTRPAFGGNLIATISCTEFRPQMATVRPGVMEALPYDEAKTGTVTMLPVNPTDKVEIIDVVYPEKQAADLTEAALIVAGGRGLSNSDNFNALYPLADALGATVAASRAAVDAGWIEKDFQVGQTGKTVRPKLYLAMGISGAIQHAAGMEESDCIIAVNNSESAPIFSCSHLGILGDARAILPKLTEAIAAYKANH